MSDSLQPTPVATPRNNMKDEIEAMKEEERENSEIKRASQV